MHEWIIIALILVLAVLLPLWWVERMPCPPDAQSELRTRIAIPECRFAPGLMRELVQNGDLNETDDCPLRRACRVEARDDTER